MFCFAESVTNLSRAVNEIDELITAMLAIALAAVMLVAGELDIAHGPVQTAGPVQVVRPAVTMASGP
jgi:hypothetical protein